MSWWKNLQERVLGRSSTPAESSDLPEQGNEPSDRVSTPPVPAPLPTVWESIFRTAPLVVFSIGLLLTVFAELVKAWAVMGFLLLASSPILYYLQRIEKRLEELNEINKTRRR